MLSPSIASFVTFSIPLQVAAQTSELRENTDTFVVSMDTCPSGVVATRSRPNLDVSVNKDIRLDDECMIYSPSGDRQCMDPPTIQRSTLDWDRNCEGEIGRLACGYIGAGFLH